MKLLIYKIFKKFKKDGIEGMFLKEKTRF